MMLKFQQYREEESERDENDKLHVICWRHVLGYSVISIR